LPRCFVRPRRIGKRGRRWRESTAAWEALHIEEKFGGKESRVKRRGKQRARVSFGERRASRASVPPFVDLAPPRASAFFSHPPFFRPRLFFSPFLSSFFFRSKTTTTDRDRPRLRRPLHPTLVPDGRQDVPHDRRQAPVEGDGEGARGPRQGGRGRSGVDLGRRRRGRRGRVVDARHRRDARTGTAAAGTAGAAGAAGAAAAANLDVVQQRPRRRNGGGGSSIGGEEQRRRQRRSVSRGPLPGRGRQPEGDPQEEVDRGQDEDDDDDDDDGGAARGRGGRRRRRRRSSSSSSSSSNSNSDSGGGLFFFSLDEAGVRPLLAPCRGDRGIGRGEAKVRGAGVGGRGGEAVVVWRARPVREGESWEREV